MQVPPRDVIEQANAAYHLGRCDQAVDMLLLAIETNRSRRDLFLKLAELLYDSERYQDAVNILSEAPVDETGDDAIALMGCCQAALGNTPAAAEAAERALILNPHGALALALQGMVAARSGDRSRSEYCYREAISRGDSWGLAHLWLGLLQWEQNLPAEAMHLLEAGFLRSPTTRELAIHYHAVALALKQFERAELSFRSVLLRHGHNRRLRFLLIDLLLRAEKTQAAMGEIEAALADFGIDDGLLSAALAVRKRLGPLSLSNGSQLHRRISLCMIAKNEEAHLARCLQSIQAVVDEIVVVDTGSTDRTRAIATAFGAHIYDFPWVDDFSKARNFSLSKASGDWVFVLDADEAVSGKDHEDLRALVRRWEEKLCAFSIQTRNYTHHSNTIGWRPNTGEYLEEQGAGWFPSDKARLFRNDRRIRFMNPVHEMVEPSLKSQGIPILNCRIPVHHYGKLNEAKTLAKTKAYSDLGREKLKKNHRSTAAIRELAIQCAHLGQHGEAINLWKEYLKKEPRAVEAFLNIGTACWNLGRCAEAAGFAEKALRINPTMKEARFNRAVALLMMGQAVETKSILQSVLEQQPNYPAARFMLCVAHACLGEQIEVEGALSTLKSLPMGEYLHVSFLDIAKKFVSASRCDYARLTLEAALSFGCANPEMVDFLESCRTAT
jgi:glycosyltransferase involved in cell wall biosynthesis/Tfp pilus assembly protein PilF